MSRIRIPVTVKLGISLLLVLVVLLRVDVSSVAHSLARADITFCLLAVAVAGIAWLVSTYKWQVLLAEPGANIKFFQLVRLNMIGMFYNLVLPGQVAGEVVKGVRLAQLGISGKRSAISVIVDRITGLLALLALGIVGVIASPSVLDSIPNLLSWLVSLALVLGTLTVVLVTGSGLGVLEKLRLPAGLVGKINPRSWHLDLGSQGWLSLCLTVLLALIFQLGLVLTNFLFCLALGIPLSYPQLLWVVAVVSFLQSLPISIAGVGVREGAYVYLLGLLGISESAALALSLLIFGTQVLFALAGGLVQLLEVWGSRHTRNPDKALHISK